MAKIERFEDIDAWKKARVLTNRVYAVTNAGTFARDFQLRDQIRSASVSVMSNIAEGFERGGGDKAFARFLSIAKGFRRVRCARNSMSRWTSITSPRPSSRNSHNS